MAQVGSVVYVLRNLNPVDFLALDHLTKRYDLPRVRFVSDLPWGVAHPLRSNILSRLQALLPADGVKDAVAAAEGCTRRGRSLGSAVPEASAERVGRRIRRERSRARLERRRRADPHADRAAARQRSACTACTPGVLVDQSARHPRQPPTRPAARPARMAEFICARSRSFSTTTNTCCCARASRSISRKYLEQNAEPVLRRHARAARRVRGAAPARARAPGGDRTRAHPTRSHAPPSAALAQAAEDAIAHMAEPDQEARRPATR